MTLEEIKKPKLSDMMQSYLLPIHFKIVDET